MYDITLSASELNWTPLDFAGVFMKELRTDPATGGMTVMTRMEPGSTIPKHVHTNADETVFVISGDFIENGNTYGLHSFFFGTHGTNHGPHTTKNGCILLTVFSAELDFVVEE